MCLPSVRLFFAARTENRQERRLLGGWWLELVIAAITVLLKINKTEGLFFMMLLHRAMGPSSVCTASTIHGRTTTNQTTAAARLKETLKGKKRFCW
jgi:hypothetical protein